jgi:hypothetical protein
VESRFSRPFEGLFLLPAFGASGRLRERRAAIEGRADALPF